MWAKRFAELTGAEWGIVTSGCAAGMFAGTCACVVGTDRDKKARIPDTTGMKNECVVSKAHRTSFDRAIRMVGVKMVEADSVDEMDAAFNKNTAMVFIWGEISGPNHPAGGNISFKDIVTLARKHNVPILVDAAAERPDVPNRYIEAGCDLIAYSGGKCLMGPNDTGLLLGRKDLCEAAFQNISPYSGMGRPMKVSKEDIMGLLAAMELWVNARDHDAEWKEWERRLDVISKRITQVQGIHTEVIPPGRLCNYAPSMTITWDQDGIKITPEELRKTLTDGNPRILIEQRKGDEFRSIGDWVSIQPYMMQPGEEIIVGDKLYEVFSEFVSQT
ncbi:aminotransferase class V-fold PLP-dependent enzyme [Candidatus Latescibacterota bacterium]